MSDSQSSAVAFRRLFQNIAGKAVVEGNKENTGSCSPVVQRTTNAAQTLVCNDNMDDVEIGGEHSAEICTNQAPSTPRAVAISISKNEVTKTTTFIDLSSPPRKNATIINVEESVSAQLSGVIDLSSPPRERISSFPVAQKQGAKDAPSVGSSGDKRAVVTNDGRTTSDPLPISNHSGVKEVLPPGVTGTNSLKRTISNGKKDSDTGTSTGTSVVAVPRKRGRPKGSVNGAAASKSDISSIDWAKTLRRKSSSFISQNVESPSVAVDIDSGALDEGKSGDGDERSVVAVKTSTDSEINWSKGLECTDPF
ncbi:hypothetical protein HDU76_005024 [Blyttiomyces sp. JEL0837]|nr:hypothetical protein HDU76_005024 [Blyttiomyces sp. JEL0837]